MTKKEFLKLPENTELSVNCNDSTMSAYEGSIVDPEEFLLNPETGEYEENYNFSSNTWYKVDNKTIGFTGSRKCRSHYKDAYFFFDEVERIKE